MPLSFDALACVGAVLMMCWLIGFPVAVVQAPGVRGRSRIPHSRRCSALSFAFRHVFARATSADSISRRLPGFSRRIPESSARAGREFASLEAFTCARHAPFLRWSRCPSNARHPRCRTLSSTELSIHPEALAHAGPLCRKHSDCAVHITTSEFESPPRPFRDEARTPLATSPSRLAPACRCISNAGQSPASHGINRWPTQEYPGQAPPAVVLTPLRRHSFDRVSAEIDKAHVGLIEISKKFLFRGGRWVAIWMKPVLWSARESRQQQDL